MVLSMAVLMVPVLIIVWFFARPGDEVVQPVDYRPVLATARAEAPYPVLAPSNLPDTWVANRVRWAKVGQPWIDGQPAPGNSWQLGFMSPGGVYVAIQQRDGQAASFVSQTTRQGRASGEVTLAGFIWQRYTSADGRTKSLVAANGAMTAIVSGDTEIGELEAFASTLVR